MDWNLRIWRDVSESDDFFSINRRGLILSPVLRVSMRIILYAYIEI